MQWPGFPCGNGIFAIRSTDWFPGIPKREGEDAKLAWQM